MKEVKNTAASVRARLLNLARSVEMDFNRILLLYGQERFLDRLCCSPYRNRFVLKGGLLLYSAYLQLARPTKDLDLASVDIKNR
jgi:hypothetical protein